jgi:hypothetical protein
MSYISTSTLSTSFTPTLSASKAVSVSTTPTVTNEQSQGFQATIFAIGGIFGALILMGNITALVLAVKRARQKAQRKAQKEANENAQPSKANLIKGARSKRAAGTRSASQKGGSSNNLSRMGSKRTVAKESEDHLASTPNLSRSTTARASETSTLVGPADQTTMSECNATTLVAPTSVLSIPAFLQVTTEAYRLRGRIAEGGMGQIHLADILDPALLGRAKGVSMCIAKISSPSNTKLPLFMTRFQQELSLMYFLHKQIHIVKLLGYTNDPPTMLIKYYPLGSLDAYIHENIAAAEFPRTSEQYFEIAFGVASGLTYMHKHFVAHCDIKPANVLLEAISSRPNTLRAVLTDFGVSQVADPQTLTVKAFKVVGIQAASRCYAAPEVLSKRKQNKPQLVLARDTYSYAVVLYEMLTGHYPWK